MLEIEDETRDFQTVYTLEYTKKQCKKVRIYKTIEEYTFPATVLNGPYHPFEDYDYNLTSAQQEIDDNIFCNKKVNKKKNTTIYFNNLLSKYIALVCDLCIIIAKPHLRL